MRSEGRKTDPALTRTEEEEEPVRARTLQAEGARTQTEEPGHPEGPAIRQGASASERYRQQHQRLRAS